MIKTGLRPVKIWVQIGLIFLVLFFWSIGNKELLSFRGLPGHEYLNLAFTAFVVYASWGIFRFIKGLLNPVRSELSDIRYFLIQGTTTTVILMAFVLLTNYLYIYWYWQSTFNENLFLELIWPLAFLLFILWNIGDWVWELYHESIGPIPKASKSPPYTPPDQGYFVMKRKGTLRRIEHSDIALFIVIEGVTQLVTHDAKVHLLDLPLNQIEATLPSHLFFRANRQVILSRKLVLEIQPDKHQKLMVQVKEIHNFPHSFSISRYKAKAFKSWWLSGERHLSSHSNHSHI